MPQDQILLEDGAYLQCNPVTDLPQDGYRDGIEVLRATGWAPEVVPASKYTRKDCARV